MYSCKGAGDEFSGWHLPQTETEPVERYPVHPEVNEAQAPRLNTTGPKALISCDAISFYDHRALAGFYEGCKTMGDWGHKALKTVLRRLPGLTKDELGSASDSGVSGSAGVVSADLIASKLAPIEEMGVIRQARLSLICCAS
ncbi:hypothetical protein SAMN05216558_0842 [Pseudomonas vancouverensis]|nr:hypothetical protein SAMN05216558_0842 [Pseudomonas vancouverensis]